MLNGSVCKGSTKYTETSVTLKVVKEKQFLTFSKNGLGFCLESSSEVNKFKYNSDGSQLKNNCKNQVSKYEFT